MIISINYVLVSLGYILLVYSGEGVLVDFIHVLFSMYKGCI